MFIAKTFTFDAAHRLVNLPAGHKCLNLHGHTYRAEIRISDTSEYVDGQLLNSAGMLVDYQVLADAWAQIAARVDHQYLNDISGLEVPTTEVFVQWIVRELRKVTLYGHEVPIFDRSGGQWSRRFQLHSVRLYESSTTWCEVTNAEVPQ